MEFKNTLEIVTKDIQDIEKLVGNFKNYSRIPNIELDLALSRLRNVYELLLMFRDDTPKEIQPSLPKNTAQEFFQKEEEKDTRVSEPVITNDSVAIASPVAESKAPSNVPTIEGSQKKTIESNHAPTTEQKSPSASGIKKKPDEQKIFIHDKLVEHSHKTDITSKLQNQAIKSIAGSLGINDKFLFIRELFAGNAETFRQTMEELDDSRNFNDAYSLLMTKFQWDMDSEPVQMLLNLIRRKFIPSGNE